MSQATSSFDAHAEARRLREGLASSVKSRRVDAVVEILARRPSHQRAAVAKAFAEIHGAPLRKEMKRRFAGDFYRVCKLLTYHLSEHDAKCLRYAIQGAGTDEQVLIDILTTRNNYQIKAIRYAYATVLHRDLARDIHGDVSGDFGRLLLLLLRANRDESDSVNLGCVQADVKIFYAAGEGRVGTDESSFNEILASRSLPHLAEMSRQYQAMYGSSLAEVIDSETSGSYRNLLLSVVSYAVSPASHIANQLYTSVKGVGTHDKRLQRTIIGFCESDMTQVKEAYRRLHGKTLADAVRSNTSGSYRRVLLALLREE